jgi:methylenetetrahydrofolate dehydrogenase (NADP+)/methenyltetrahydrofolate cyclohydrolase
MTIFFDGKKFAREREERLKNEIKKRRFEPKLVVVLIGDDPASRLYVEKKKEAAERVGIEFELKEFKKTVSESEVIDYIEKKNAEKKMTGIMVQLPLPEKLDELNIRRAIHPFKDVDCLHPKNLGLVMIGKPLFYPATVKAVLEVLKRAARGTFFAQSRSGFAALKGMEVVIVGGSNLVGKPLAMVLSNFGATVTLCRSTTRNLADHTRKADILISATGKPGLIKKEVVKKGAVVIDVGETKGDVAKDVVQRASFLTSVPGGVGPVTVVSLLENLVK